MEEKLQMMPLCVSVANGPVKPLKTSGVKWSTAAMVAFMIGSIIIPLIGIAFGIIGLTKDEKRAQGLILLAIGITMIIYIPIYSNKLNYANINKIGGI